ncbi:hypothetical protein ABIB38_004681 [Massilia sp. UYP11]|uniref:hypothetical protein n=1 Tax=Massilia sp. UYP11 TaxID=1756385 RepID=UPI003D1A91B6
MKSCKQLLVLAACAASSLGTAPARAADTAVRASFQHAHASPDAVKVADWVIGSNNHRDLPFMIVDKKAAMVYVFDGKGQLRGSAAALLGAAVGDDSVPGIGERKISSILPEERTTPAGRFVAALARNIHGKEILWVDYAAAISLHRVATGNRAERRAERLASATTQDNRISYGCINVAATFFDKIVMPAFKNNGIVYVLPETKSLQQVFASYSEAKGLSAH